MFRTPARWLAATGLPLLLVVSSSLSLTQVSAEAASSWSIKARDGFGHSKTSGWAKAEKGGTWAISASGKVKASVRKGKGLVTELVTYSKFTATLPKVMDESNAKSSVLISGLKALDLFHSWRVRQSADGSHYYAVTYRSNAAGSATLSISRVINGNSALLANTKVSVRPKSGKKLRLAYELTGKTSVQLKAKVWRTGVKQPGWQLSVADTAANRIVTPGTVALSDYIGKAAAKVSLRYDNVLIKARTGTAAAVLPTPTPTPLPTPSATPTPTATVAASTRRGTTIGSAKYAIPSGAKFVSSTSGSDSAAGTQAAPYKTVARALAVAGSGATIVLRAGTYHESVIVDEAAVIQNYPGEAAWFDGSKQVTNWTKSGSTWVASGWTATHSRTMGGDAALRARYVDSDNSVANYPDMVFVNGTQLTQVASAANVIAGKFYVDESADKLIIGIDPSGKDVRASDLEQAIKVTASNVTLQGFGVRRYATPYESRGAILSDPETGVLRDLVVSDNATIGIAVNRPGKIVDRVVAERNGLLGIGSTKANGLRLTNSIVRGNNSENFKTEPVAGGVKITSSSGVLAKNNEVRDNLQSTGLWFDVKSLNVTVVGNDLINNGVAQLEVEISKGAIVADNLAIGGQKGILIFDTEDVKIFNNEVGGQSQFGIKIAQDARWQADADATFSLKSHNITVSNNVFGTGKLFQFYALDGATGISADSMAITLHGNLFNKRVVSTDPTMVALGRSDNVTLDRYETPATLAAAKNSAWKNAQTTSCLSLSAMDSAITAAQSVAVGLPSDVAASVGKASGFKMVGRIS